MTTAPPNIPAEPSEREDSRSLQRNHVTIRRATIADANDIARIHVDASRTAYRGIYADEYLASLTYEERAKRWLKGSLAASDLNVIVFVAYDNGRVIGFADTGISSDTNFKNHAEINSMYLDLAYIGQGVGFALFRKCLEHFGQRGFNKFIIRVLVKNIAARKFYERQGGQPVPSSEKTIKTGWVEENIITYEWPDLAELKSSKGEDKKSPQRKCVVSGESFDKETLLRFVRAPDGTLTFDVSAKLPGRGAYVTCDAAAVETALKKNLFAKSFKDKTKTPPNTGAQIVQQLEQAALQYLAFARRAGDAVAGSEKCIEFVRKHRIAAVVLASDASQDGKSTAKKLADTAPIIADFDRDRLGAIFGREQAVVIALATGGIAKKFLTAIGRYQALKTLENHKEKA